MYVADMIINIFTAIGTIGATILALWLAVHDKMRRVDAVFVWGIPTEYQPMLFVKNMGNKAVVLDCIQIKYNRREVCKIDVFNSTALREYAIFKPFEEKTIPLGNRIPTIDAPKKQKRQYLFEVIIVPRQGRKFISKQKYSYDDIGELLFGCALFSEK